MNSIKRIAVLLYVTTIMVISSYILLVASQTIRYAGIGEVFHAIYVDRQLQILASCIAGLMIIMNFAFYRTFSVKQTQDRVIAFDNPSGRVSVSLNALEDLVKRTLASMSELKDIKSDIHATKKGLRVKLRLMINAKMSIPEITSKVQRLVKSKIQDTVGIEEAVDVSIYVGKIVTDGSVSAKSCGGEPDEQASQPTNIPFQGYRA